MERDEQGSDLAGLGDPWVKTVVFTLRQMRHLLAASTCTLCIHCPVSHSVYYLSFSFFIAFIPKGRDWVLLIFGGGSYLFMSIWYLAQNQVHTGTQMIINQIFNIVFNLILNTINMLNI